MMSSLSHLPCFPVKVAEQHKQLLSAQVQNPEDPELDASWEHGRNMGRNKNAARGNIDGENEILIHLVDY